MANTYAKLETEYHVYGKDKLPVRSELTLTAFVGGDKHTQLTVRSQQSTAFITLGNIEVDNLIEALLERKNGIVTATGGEQSMFCPHDTDEDEEAV